MKIHYKFNKSSEARDCIAESVELEIEEVEETIETPATEEDIKRFVLIDRYISEDIKEKLRTNIYSSIEILIEDIIQNDRIYEESIEITDYDLGRSYEEGIISIIFSPVEDVEIDLSIDVRVYNSYYNGSEVIDYTANLSTTNTKSEAQTKTFNSKTELKQFINELEEPIEFVTESDLDQVLLKEWLCDWEYKPFTLDLIDTYNEELNNSLQYKNVTKTFPIEEFKAQLLIDRGDEEWFTLDRVNNITIKDLTTKDLKDSSAQDLNSSIDVNLRENYSEDKDIAQCGKTGWMFSLKDKIYFVGYCYENYGYDCVEIESAAVNKNNIYEVTSTYYKNKCILKDTWKFIIE